MTPAQLQALMGYTSAVAMYLAGDGNYKRLCLARDLLEQAFNKSLHVPAPPANMPDIL